MDIVNLKNKHEGEDIYIIASGKSLDYFDLSFFDNKTTIGINQVYKKLATTYLLRKEYKFLPEIMETVPDTVHIVSRGNCGSNNNKNIDYIRENNIEAYVFDHYKNNCNYQGLPPEGQIVVSWSTITSGIHMAAYMGAKNIILVGHDCGTLDGESNCTGYHTDTSRAQGNEAKYVDWLKRIENQTVALKRDLQEVYGCNVFSLNPFINFNLEGHVYVK